MSKSRPHPNWIAGSWAPARAGATFERGGEYWSQSGAEDIAAALEAAGRAQAPAGLAMRLLEALRDDPERHAGLARRVGLPGGDLVAADRGLDQLAGTFLERPRPRESGPAIVAGDWRRGLAGLAEDVLEALLRGRGVIVLPDARVPDLGARLACAAERVGAGTSVAVLFGMPRELLAHALELGHGTGLSVTAAGSRARRIELRRACEAHAIEATRLVPLRVGVAEVDATGDLEGQAGELIEAAFGRERTLGGQLSGALGRVHCPERRFSTFTAALLAGLESAPCVREPLPLIDAEAVAAARSACSLGLDEGATLIAGGAVGPEPERVVAPMVFTNVEPAMASARRQDPLPVLCLLRQS
jgi:acyl-CoA reductase-like NAD-dependent aldehyde dehydrogenase